MIKRRAACALVCARAVAEGKKLTQASCNSKSRSIGVLMSIDTDGNRRAEISRGVPQAGRTPVRLLLTVREAAQALSVSERSLWTLTRQGAIRCVRLGRSVRYSLDDLRAFVEAQR